MSGHSKFKTIMHRKGVQDARRSRQFSKLAREITIAARGNPDPVFNPRLRTVIANARALSMPKDNIERAVRKAEGGDADSYEEIRYEGFAPGGVALIVEALTDNRNRTITDVRTIFAKGGGNLASSGAVSHSFQRLGQIVYPASAGSADKLFEAALEAGADDVDSDEEEHVIWTPADTLHEAEAALEALLGSPQSAKIAWRPNETVDVDADTVRQLLKMIDALEDLDDVQNVYGNHSIADDVFDSL